MLISREQNRAVDEHHLLQGHVLFIGPVDAPGDVADASVAEVPAMRSRATLFGQLRPQNFHEPDLEPPERMA